MVVLKRSTTKKNKTTGVEGVRHRVLLALALSAYTVPALLALLEGDAQAQGLGLAPGQGPDANVNVNAAAATTTATSSTSSSQAIVKASSGSGSSSSGGAGGGGEFVSGVVSKVDQGAGLISVRLDDGRLAALHKHQVDNAHTYIHTFRPRSFFSHYLCSLTIFLLSLSFFSHHLSSLTIFLLSLSFFSHYLSSLTNLLFRSLCRTIYTSVTQPTPFLDLS